MSTEQERLGMRWARLSLVLDAQMTAHFDPRRLRGAVMERSAGQPGPEPVARRADALAVP